MPACHFSRLRGGSAGTIQGSWCILLTVNEIIAYNLRWMSEPFDVIVNRFRGVSFEASLVLWRERNLERQQNIELPDSFVPRTLLVCTHIVYLTVGVIASSPISNQIVKYIRFSQPREVSERCSFCYRNRIFLITCMARASVLSLLYRRHLHRAFNGQRSSRFGCWKLPSAKNLEAIMQNKDKATESVRVTYLGAFLVESRRVTSGNMWCRFCVQAFWGLTIGWLSLQAEFQSFDDPVSSVDIIVKFSYFSSID